MQIGGGQVRMENPLANPGQGFKCPLDQVFAALSESHDENIFRDQILIYQSACEIKIILAGRRESHFDGLKSKTTQQLEIFKLLPGIKWIRQGLVSIPKID